MSNFWGNLYKFPRFLITVIIGFFLTTFKPIFKLLKSKKRKILFILIILIILIIIYKILVKMTRME
uniref:Uncharacterized protein ycf33 n=1 Tax=Dasyclonium flaccidum TaxID=2007274 RepID=A0A1Z1MLS6_9FLOR|nr:hypothetical protein [Dasyclonium flaccidum]ARW66704.1 hypothetical protein [Dasyclonium flaccidum]